MRAVDLECKSVDAASRVKQTQAFVEHGGFNRVMVETFDPEPSSGDCSGYNDDVPYPFSQDEDTVNSNERSIVAFELEKSEDAISYTDDCPSERMRVALLLGSIVLFVVALLLALL
jgi:hypothetical protein